MRREAPPERMTAASILIPVTEAQKSWLACDCGLPAFALEFFVCDAGCVAAHGDEFRSDADGNFFRRESADVHAHGREDAFEFLGAVALCFECFVSRKHFALAADHADVARVGAYGPAENAHVLLMPACDDDEIRRGVRLNSIECFFEADDDLIGHGKAFAICKLFAVVNHDYAEACGACGSRNGH